MTTIMPGVTTSELTVTTTPIGGTVTIGIMMSETAIGRRMANVDTMIAAAISSKMRDATEEREIGITGTGGMTVHMAVDQAAELGAPHTTEQGGTPGERTIANTGKGGKMDMAAAAAGDRDTSVNGRETIDTILGPGRL